MMNLLFGTHAFGRLQERNLIHCAPQIALGSLVLKAEGHLRCACVVASPRALTSHMPNILVWSELQLKKQNVLIIKYMRYC